MSEQNQDEAVPVTAIEVQIFARCGEREYHIATADADRVSIADALTDLAAAIRQAIP